MNKYPKEFIDELSTASRIKKAVYGYFYQIFKAPVDKNFIGLTEQFIPYFKELAKNIDGNTMKDAVTDIEQYIKIEKNAKNKYALLNDLNLQYTELFSLGAGSIPACASVFLSADGLLKGEEWEKICLIYERRGFQVPEYFKEPEDNIAIETLYMAKLNELALQLADANNSDKIKIILQEQKEFLDKHIIAWIKDFTCLVASKSEDKPLYKGAAMLLAEFATYDSGLLQEFLDEI